MNAPVIFACYDCGQKIRAPREKVGETTRCPRCRADLIVLPEEQLEAQQSPPELPTVATPPLVPEVPAAQASRPFKVLGIGCSSIVLFFCLLSCVSSLLFPDRRSTYSSSPRASPPSEAKSVPREPDHLAGISRSLRERIETVDVNNGVAFVRFRVADNLTTGMIRSGAKISVRDILKSLIESDRSLTEVKVVGVMELRDKLGNSSNVPLLTLNYSGQTLRKINWDHILFENMFDVADHAVLHPDMR